MVSSRAEETPVSFSEVGKLGKIDSHIYKAFLNEAFCIRAGIGIHFYYTPSSCTRYLTGSSYRGGIPFLEHSLGNWNFYLPREGPLAPAVLDMWIRFASGEPITQAALPYVVDSFPYNLHTFLAAPELRKLLIEPPPKPTEDAEGARAAKEIREQDKQRATIWLPTVVMNLEAKRPLPDEGVEWLAVRVTSKQIKDGRFDLDVLVGDVDGTIVALSHHVAMILSIERNTGKKQSSSAKPAL